MAFYRQRREARLFQEGVETGGIVGTYRVFISIILKVSRVEFLKG